MTALADISRDVYGAPVPLFETFISNSAEIRVAEDEHRPLTQQDHSYPLFANLAEEVIGKLPNFCRPSATEAGVKEVAS
jgi:hypothetical protein